MRILFMDVDGPLIPLRMHWQVGSVFKYAEVGGYYIWDPNVIKYFNDYCPKLDIKIVFNSSHNTSGADVLRMTARSNGLDPSILHDDVCTKYPDIDNRVEAIYDWLKRNVPKGQSCKWMVVDDFDLPVGQHLMNVTLESGLDDKKLETIFGKFLLTDRAPKLSDILWRNE